MITLAGKLLSPLAMSLCIAGNMSGILAGRMPFSALKKPADANAPKLSDIMGTLKGINYRYDFPQKLTEQQKKTMKRFDVFR